MTLTKLVSTRTLDTQSFSTLADWAAVAEMAVSSGVYTATYIDHDVMKGQPFQLSLIPETNPSETVCSRRPNIVYESCSGEATSKLVGLGKPTSNSLSEVNPDTFNERLMLVEEDSSGNKIEVLKLHIDRVYKTAELIKLNKGFKCSGKNGFEIMKHICKSLGISRVLLQDQATISFHQKSSKTMPLSLLNIMKTGDIQSTYYGRQAAELIEGTVWWSKAEKFDPFYQSYSLLQIAADWISQPTLRDLLTWSNQVDYFMARIEKFLIKKVGLALDSPVPEIVSKYMAYSKGTANGASAISKSNSEYLHYLLNPDSFLVGDTLKQRQYVFAWDIILNSQFFQLTIQDPRPETPVSPDPDQPQTLHKSVPDMKADLVAWISGLKSGTAPSLRQFIMPDFSEGEFKVRATDYPVVSPKAVKYPVVSETPTDLPPNSGPMINTAQSAWHSPKRRRIEVQTTAETVGSSASVAKSGSKRNLNRQLLSDF